MTDELIAAIKELRAFYAKPGCRLDDAIHLVCAAAERAEADRDALREALQAATKAMNDECLHYAQYGEQPPQHLLDAIDAARAKVGK